MLLDRVMSGGVSVNDALFHVGQHDLPFGGVGESGMGHYHGYEGFQTFSKLRPVFYQARAGFVLVNVNPLYTPRELEHQLKDSGAKAIVVLENFATTLQQVAAKVPTKHVIVASMGDLLGLKGLVVNTVVRRVKKLVPAFSLPGSVSFKQALIEGRRMSLKATKVGPDDIAVLQYTGGTTGVSKGAMLLHRNLVANILQSEAWYGPAVAKVPKDQQFTVVCALPIYHVFGFTACIMLGMRMGSRNILVANPRDMGAVFKDLKGEVFHSFPAVNTLFNAMANHPDFGSVDWRNLVLSVGGGMAVQSGHRGAVAGERPAARSARATACPKPAPRRAATRWTRRPTPAPSVCRCPTPSWPCSTTTAARCPWARPARSRSAGRR
jgi:acyl-CoA synthetase (AMP-forming)/AMP-acid ligase II